MGIWKILKSIGIAVAMGFLLAMTATVYGQEEDELMMRRGASTDEIMGTLRSIRRPKSEGTPTAVAVRIYFAHDSAELTPETKVELANYVNHWLQVSSKMLVGRSKATRTLPGVPLITRNSLSDGQGRSTTT